MDLLEKYKKAWDNQPEETNKVSKIDIYKMAQSKSSSIVKWIFIIGVLEFIFVATINFLFRINPEEYKELDNPIGRNLGWIELFSYVIIVYFLVQFYKNYKSISTSDNTKTLMNKILKTRKTVKTYVLLNLTMIFVVSIIAVGYAVYAKDFDQSGFTFYAVIIIVTILMVAFILFLYWLFYQLLYGILLRKLNKNYKELAKLEELN